MRIGLVTPLHGRPGAELPAPSWASVSELAQTAEASGFDSFVFEDALLYRSESATDGSWESVSIAAALAVATERIHIGQSVVNSPYREPALMAKIADTLDEISGGRYIFGIGAGNTATSDYLAFGAPTDRRYSRFAEGIEIIHSLLKTGRVDFQGEFYSARDAELVLRGPRKGGPPINIAGSGSKMLRLVARFADAWNWWTYNETLAEVTERMGPIVSELETACYETGRNPEDIDRTIDVYTIVPPGMPVPEGSDGLVSGSAEEIAGYLVGLRDLGFTEARCDLTAKTPAGVRAMANVVAMVHGG